MQLLKQLIAERNYQNVHQRQTFLRPQMPPDFSVAAIGEATELFLREAIERALEDDLDDVQHVVIEADEKEYDRQFLNEVQYAESSQIGGLGAECE